MRKTSAIILVITILMGVSGCMNNNYNKPKRISIQEHMLNYIQARYPDDIFTYIALHGGGAGITERQILVKSEKFPERNILVTYNNIDGKEIFGDNYIYLLYEDQTREFIDEILSGVFADEYRLSYNAPLRVNALNLADTATFEGFLSANPMIGFSVIVVPGYDIGDKNAFEEKLNNAFMERKLCVNSGNFHFPDESINYQFYKNATIMELRAGRDIPSLFVIGLGSEEADFRWR